MSGQRRRRWTNIKLTMDQRPVLSGSYQNSLFYAIGQLYFMQLAVVFCFENSIIALILIVSCIMSSDFFFQLLIRNKIY